MTGCKAGGLPHGRNASRRRTYEPSLTTTKSRTAAKKPAARSVGGAARQDLKLWMQWQWATRRRTAAHASAQACVAPCCFSDSELCMACGCARTEQRRHQGGALARHQWVNNRPPIPQPWCTIHRPPHILHVGDPQQQRDVGQGQADAGGCVPPRRPALSGAVPPEASNAPPSPANVPQVSMGGAALLRCCDQHRLQRRRLNVHGHLQGVRGNDRGSPAGAEAAGGGRVSGAGRRHRPGRRSGTTGRQPCAYVPILTNIERVGMPPGPRGAGRAENDLTAVLTTPSRPETLKSLLRASVQAHKRLAPRFGAPISTWAQQPEAHAWR